MVYLLCIKKTWCFVNYRPLIMCRIFVALSDLVKGLRSSHIEYFLAISDKSF
jgi:hypothetical protein